MAKGVSVLSNPGPGALAVCRTSIRCRFYHSHAVMHCRHVRRDDYQYGSSWRAVICHWTVDDSQKGGPLGITALWASHTFLSAAWHVGGNPLSRFV